MTPRDKRLAADGEAIRQAKESLESAYRLRAAGVRPGPRGVRQIARPSKGQIKRAMDFLAPAKP